MVTLPPSPQLRPHRHPTIAQSFGVAPERYDRARPPYPAAMIERILATGAGALVREVLDVGCGTGIEARQFRAAGCSVLGVDPDPRMARVARAAGIDVEVATFEKWEPRGRTFDAVIAGTAWHWVDPVAGAARAALVLRPGGVLAPFGHVYELPGGVAHALAEAFRRAAPDSTLGAGGKRGGSNLDGYRALYERAADGIRQAGGFGEPELWRYAWKRPYTREELLDLVATSGGLTSLAPDAAGQVLAAVEAAIDDLAGELSVPYATWGLTVIRLDY